jgi:hypothetical protein
VAADLNKGERIRFNEELTAAAVESNNRVKVPPDDAFQLNSGPIGYTLNATRTLDLGLSQIAAYGIIILVGCPEPDMVNTLRSSCVAIQIF